MKQTRIFAGLLVLGLAAGAAGAAGEATLAAGFPQPPVTAVLRDKEAQRALDLSPAQRAEVERLSTAAGAEAKALMLLTPPQRERLERIRTYAGLGYRTAGALAVVDGLSAEQVKQLKSLAQATTLKRVNLFYDFEFENGGAQGPSKPENPRYAARVQALEAEAAVKVREALTAEQGRLFMEARTGKK